MATIDQPIIVPLGPADAMLRTAAHEHLRAGHVEDLSWISTHPAAPEDLLLEFCDLGLYLDQLGHRASPRQLLERMAEVHRYPEAIITLAIQLYTKPEESPESFDSFLERHADSSWMLDSLARVEASSPEKERSYLAVAERHPEAGRFLHQVEVRRWEAAAKSSNNRGEIERLYASAEPDVWLALAANPHVPEELIEKLAAVRGVKHAAEIRERAKRNSAK